MVNCAMLLVFTVCISVYFGVFVFNLCLYRV